MSTPGPEPNNELFLEFLDDYFVECEDHLRSVRRNLLALEQYVNGRRVDRSLLDALFRSFHSIKGISGMVGLREAEQLAHNMESYLRALRENQVALSPEGIDTLIAGARMLEEVIAEFRAGAQITNAVPLMEQLSRLVPERSPGARAPGESESRSVSMPQPDPVASYPFSGASANGVKVWLFEFLPSAVLARRGVNVNSLRERLQGIGELIHSAPRVMDEGKIAFEFLVASAEDEAIFAGWRDDGLVYRAYESPSIAVQAKKNRIDSDGAVPQLKRSLASSNVVRVDLGRLDQLMRLVGDLVISRSRLDDNLKKLEPGLAAPDWRPLQEINLTVERQLRDLRDGILRARMVPIGEIFERMQFAARDIAQEYRKQVRVELAGEHTEIDKLLVERMMDPILHLVRNAVSHGIESPAERIAAGKPAEGKVTLRASTASQTAVIEIEDDGRGIDAAQIAKRAVALGLIEADSTVDADTLLELICSPDFSSVVEADRASGRGVGMAVVKNTVAGLGGSIELESDIGLKTRFAIRLPLTLAIADALIVTAGGQSFAVPQSAVVEVLEIEAAAVKVFENNEIISHRGGVLPLLRLARLFNLEQRSARYYHVFVIGTGLNSVGVLVDRILGQREIVVRAVSDPMIQVPGIAGATELGDGRIVLILDPADAVRAARNSRAKGRTE